jgi:hypothetical protein
MDVKRTGPKMNKVTGGWIKLHIEEICDMYSSRNTIWLIRSRRVKWAEHVAGMGEKRNMCMVWWKNLKRPLGITRHRRERNRIGGH